MILVEAVSISKSYAGNRVLDRVGASFQPGLFTSLLGPSGSGKTTLLRIIGGFVAPDEGEVRFDGVDVTGVPLWRRNVGMVFQSYALFPHMTVQENVVFGLNRRGVRGEAARKETARALEMVRLTGFEQRRPKQLSGGQQQRVALARAMVTKPRVLLLDESLSALDRRLRQEMQIELRRIQRQSGLTTIFVTHDQEEALTLSDTIAILDGVRSFRRDGPRKSMSGLIRVSPLPSSETPTFSRAAPCKAESRSRAQAASFGRAANCHLLGRARRSRCGRRK